MPTIEEYQKDGLHEDIRAFQIELARKFPDYRVTSGLRPNAKTKQGRASRHATGEALDIGFRKDIRDYLWDTPEGLSMLERHGLGLIDESTPEMLKKTGGTGAHLHIGKDTSYVKQVQERAKQFVKPSNVSQTQPSITNNISDLPPIKETPIFTESEVKKEESPEKVQMQQELDEYNLKQEIQQRFANVLQGQQPMQQVEEEQFQQAPVKTIEQIYGEASQIVGDDQVPMQQGGSIPISSQGVYEVGAREVIVPTTNGKITMSQVPYPIIGTDEYGNQQMMLPNQNYQFPGKTIHEIPQLQDYFKQKYNK